LCQSGQRQQQLPAMLVIGTQRSREPFASSHPAAAAVAAAAEDSIRDRCSRAISTLISQL